MEKLVTIAFFGLFTGAIALADTINGGTLLPFPNASEPANCGGSPGAQGANFYSNCSLDGPQRNLGYLLTNAGGFSGGTNVAPVNYLTNGSATGVNAPPAFNFIRTSSALSITLLAAVTALDGPGKESLGWYVTDATGSVHGAETTLFNSLAASLNTTIAFNPTQFYGFFISACVVGGPSGQCGSSTPKYYTNPAFNTISENIANHQHFAAFGLANLLAAQGQSTYFLGAEDQPNTTGVEAYGDFQDVVFRVVGVPEPATFALLGAGLIGIALLARRRKRV